MKKYKFLIVDDIFSNQLLLISIIESTGNEYKVASDGKKAVAALEAEDFDIILMDIEMPVMNGIETAKYIRENFEEPKKSIPIFALTAHNKFEFFDNINTAGFTEFLSKPYSLERFRNLIQKYIDKNENL
jgi:CheY-like chemotaxis protein